MTTRARDAGGRRGGLVVATLLAGAVAGCAGPDDAAHPDQAATVEAPAPRPAAGPARFGFGREATHDEIAAWDIDVMPDGAGLPSGGGTVDSGAAVYARHCASCHGRDGTGGSGGALVGLVPGGGPPFGPTYEAWRGDSDHLPYTVGNYWPYATTLFDYINRAMPSGAPGSLSADQVYGLVAWLLAQNEIVAADAIMNAETLPAVEMPARDLFVPDDRQGGPEVK